ncbi:MAG: bpX6 domain-containing protein [Acidobacteriota bacterium]
MRGPLPRALVHRGVVEASGFLVDATLAGPLEARRRVVDLWVPGTAVYQVARGWLVRLPAPQRVACDLAPGLPLVAEKVAPGGTLVGAPLDPVELRALDPPAGSVVRPRAGHTVAERHAEADREDPAAWLDVEGFGFAPTSSLGAPPVQPRLSSPAPVEFDARTRLKGVPAAAPELAEVLAALSRREPSGERPKPPRHRLSPVGMMLNGLHTLRWSLRGWRRPAIAGGAEVAMAPSGTWSFGIAGERPGPRRAGAPFGSRFAAGFHRLSARLRVASSLSSFLGRRNAAYIQRMIEMFEEGDLLEALRYAIPLGSEVADTLRGLPLRIPSPRKDLSVKPDSKPSWTVVHFAPDLYGELQRIYRAAFERLEAQGSVEEAAFVLAEVLHAHEEAVAFLERNGRLWLAAEMAEARHLPPGLLVRQWFLAGDRERAFWIARRTGAFADAVTRLERTRNSEEAESLRLLWAAGLAEAGDYAAAVDAIWPIPEARHMALEWMDRAIEQGGTSAGRVLARKVTLAPDLFEEVRDRVQGLLESWRAEGASQRLAFAEALGQGPRTPAAQTLARAAVRAVARDSGRFGARMSPARFRQLVAFADDGALKADAPALPLPDREPWIAREGIWRIEIAGTDAGTMPAWDVAFLPSGLTAVALGEAGVRLLSRAGRSVADLDQPAHRLVVSDLGDRAIALARRGAAARLARIDLASRRAEPWCDARFEAFAPDYDGALWYVVSPDGLIAVDATSRRFDGPWGVPVQGRVLTLARSASRCSLVTGGEDPEVLTYEAPALQLRSRLEVPITARGRVGGTRQLAVAPDGSVAEQWVSAAVLQLKLHGAPPLQIPLPGEDWEPGELVLSGDWLVGSAYGPGSARVFLVHRGTGRVKGEVILGRAKRVTLHLQGQTLNLADDRGRILVLDLEYGQIRRDLRL